MKVFELTTGFIAAVMIALGAAYYVNNSATVGEEPVVETTAETAPAQDCVWYEYFGANFGQPGYNLDIENASKYSLYETDPENGPGCAGSQQICAVCLPPTDGEHPEPADLEDIADEIRSGSEVPGLIMVKTVL